MRIRKRIGLGQSRYSIWRVDKRYYEAPPSEAWIVPLLSIKIYSITVYELNCDKASDMIKKRILC